MNISTVESWLAGSASLNLVFLLIAIISFLASVLFYFRSKKEKTPVYLIKTYPLIKNDIKTIEALSINYNGVEIKNLALAKISLWNKGKQTINGTDIVATDPLRIDALKDVKILGASLSFTRRKVNSIEIGLVDNQVKVNFDYLDQNDGCIIDVYYSGEKALELSGSIKGVKSIDYAKIPDDHFLDKYLFPIYLRLGLRQKKDSVINDLYIKAIIVITLPIAVPLLFLNASISLFQIVPKEYSLHE